MSRRRGSPSTCGAQAPGASPPRMSPGPRSEHSSRPCPPPLRSSRSDAPWTARCRPSSNRSWPSRTRQPRPNGTRSSA
ncbi:hypothetical protein D514_0114105 [Microbacterium sp. UCD-TDU]|nr:hypothetical protein D514_0114105 [Microbacterium sp. UCD-TDU]